MSKQSTFVQATFLQKKDHRHSEDTLYRAVARANHVDVVLYSVKHRSTWLKRILVTAPVTSLDVNPDHVVVRWTNRSHVYPLVIPRDDILYGNEVSGALLYRICDDVYRLCCSPRDVMFSYHFIANKIVRFENTIVSVLDSGYKVACIINGKLWHQLSSAELEAEDVKAWLHLNSERTDIALYMESIDTIDFF